MNIISSSDCVTEEHEKTREDNSSEDIQVQYTISLDIFFTSNSNIKNIKNCHSHQFCNEHTVAGRPSRLNAPL